MKYITTFIFLTLLTLTLLISEIIQRLICLYNPLRQDRVVLLTSKITLFLLKIFCGVSLDVEGFENIVKDNKPFIIVSNHQSLLDIPILIAVFGNYKIPRFIAKKELSKSIPCISLNLRKGGSVLINRNNPKSALKDIKKGGEEAFKHNFPMAIFPEGTRSLDSNIGEFKTAGFKFLRSPYPEDTNIYPVKISGSNKLNPKGKLSAVIYGQHQIQVQIYPPVKNNNTSTLLTEIRDVINS